MNTTKRSIQPYNLPQLSLTNSPRVGTLALTARTGGTELGFINVHRLIALPSREGLPTRTDGRRRRTPRGR